MGWILVSRSGLVEKECADDSSGLGMAVWPAFAVIYPTQEKANNVRSNQYRWATFFRSRGHS